MNDVERRPCQQVHEQARDGRLLAEVDTCAPASIYPMSRGHRGF